MSFSDQAQKVPFRSWSAAPQNIAANQEHWLGVLDNPEPLDSEGNIGAKSKLNFGNNPSVILQARLSRHLIGTTIAILSLGDGKATSLCKRNTHQSMASAGVNAASHQNLVKHHL